MIKRIGTIIFAALAAVLATLALLEVTLHGQLIWIDARLLGGVAVIGTGFLLLGLVSTRERAADLAGRTDRLAALTSELEAFIAALEAANKRLHASEARYKGLVDAQGDAILRRTPDGRLTYANEAFFRLFGVRPDEVIGTVFRPEPHPDSPPPVFGRMAGREMGRERVSYDQHVKTVAGYRWIAWEDYAIRDSDGRLVEIQSVGRDITERKQLEAALTDARDKAQDANRAKSHFLATISHEIRTPMNGVLGMARLLLETQLAPDQKTYAEAIRQSGLSLLSLIEDILDFSKIESGALVVERTDVALRPLMEGIAELLSTRAHAKGIEIMISIAADVPEMIQADPIRLRQVLTNLVGNAIKFTEDGGVLISATVEREGEQHALHLSVRDTGVGVPPEKQEHIFEDFVQADSSHARRFEGTGLGLAISKRLVEAMGGSIGVRSAADKGSVFWVTLPLEGVALRREKSPPLKGKRVAIVSESPILRIGLKLQLGAAGAETVECRDLTTVAKIKNKCDALIFDAKESEPLPKLSGLHIPVVALVSPQYRATLSGLRENGLSGYLTKPVRQSSLESRLKTVMSGETSFDNTLIMQAAERRQGKHLSVLMAEDNPVNALLARELLRRRGHAVHEVSTGEAAVDVCSKQRFDLVIMDLHMPGLDGIEATRRIRVWEKETGAKPTPIIALTADALETGRRACIEAGMDGFLTKPVDPVELDSILATITPGTAAAA
jgi:PAS domain S-box-containing protein